MGWEKELVKACPTALSVHFTLENHSSSSGSESCYTRKTATRLRVITGIWGLACSIFLLNTWVHDLGVLVVRAPDETVTGQFCRFYCFQYVYIWDVSLTAWACFTRATWCWNFWKVESLVSQIILSVMWGHGLSASCWKFSEWSRESLTICSSFLCRRYWHLLKAAPLFQNCSLLSSRYSFKLSKPCETQFLNPSLPPNLDFFSQIPTSLFHKQPLRPWQKVIAYLLLQIPSCLSKLISHTFYLLLFSVEAVRSWLYRSIINKPVQSNLSWGLKFNCYYSAMHQ